MHIVTFIVTFINSQREKSCDIKLYLKKTKANTHFARYARYVYRLRKMQRRRIDFAFCSILNVRVYYFFDERKKFLLNLFAVLVSFFRCGMYVCIYVCVPHHFPGKKRAIAMYVCEFKSRKLRNLPTR